jgi:biotin synthase
MTHTLRHDWNRAEILALFNLPFNDLLFRAQQVHREHFRSQRGCR